MHIVSDFGPGGAQMGIIRLINAFPDHNFRHSICSFGSEMSMANLVKPGNEYFSLGVNGKSHLAFLSLARLLNKKGVDIVHVNNLSIWGDTLVASKIAGCRCVETFHGIELNSIRFSFLKKTLFKILAVWSSRVTAVSESAAELLGKITGLSRSKINIIPNGIDTDFFSPCGSIQEKLVIRRQLGLPANSFLFGCVAALRPVKNHLDLLFAFSELLTRINRPAHLILVGDGPSKADIEKKCRNLGIEKNVIFSGHCLNVRDFLLAMDVFVLNSKTEGLSYSILEAMSCGLAIIATSVGSNPQLISHGEEGFLVKPGDTPALSNFLEKAMENPERLASMGFKARKKVYRTYGINQMVCMYYKLYRDVIFGP